ncbi:MAG TPA: hypothetical protein VG456_21755 [Candidatus Sulfopaludibacter sp.]|jgi:hypothetical protein|nr:hypothetical protein [Candidatus Sulfopaludibacter sp.]
MTPITLPGQQARDIDLAHQLASETTQKAAADALAASGQEKVPLLLEWIKTPPFPLDDVQLTTFDAGLADAFGALKVKEAIPFLTRNITIRRSPFTLPPWKTAETVMERLPAVAALIRIGADALKALIDAPYSPMDMDQRLARIFVVSRIAATVSDKTQAIQYLRHAQAEARLQNYWADEALQFVGDR